MTTRAKATITAMTMLMTIRTVRLFGRLLAIGSGLCEGGSLVMTLLLPKWSNCQAVFLFLAGWRDRARRSRNDLAMGPARP